MASTVINTDDFQIQTGDLDVTAGHITQNGVGFSAIRASSNQAVSSSRDGM